ncbi:hypothetical protein GOODEAATRI_004377, partial [Goodea atripinnis]
MLSHSADNLSQMVHVFVKYPGCVAVDGDQEWFTVELTKVNTKTQTVVFLPHTDN